MDYNTLTSVINELSQLLTGARVERINEGADGALYLALSRERKRFALLLSPDRRMPRLHLATDKPVSAASPRGFCLYLRSHVTGCRIGQISLLNQDRVVELRLSRPGREYRIIFELTGAAANLVITDASAIILAVYYPVPFAEHVQRALLPGIQYVLPRKKTGASKEMDGTPSSASGSSGGETIGPANREAELFYNRLIGQKQSETLRNSLRSQVKKALTRIERRIAALSSDLDAAGRAEEYRQYGDLILANLDRIRAGTDEVALTDSEGKTVSLPLDPKRSPTSNAGLYFKKYKKAKAGKTIMTARIEQAGEEAALLRSALSDLERAEDLGELDEIRSGFSKKGYFPPEPKRRGAVRAGSAPDPFRKLTYHGWEILVGRSAAGNDFLTTKVARDEDLWLHAEGMSGSHVVVRNPSKGDIPPPVIARAASLAAFYSKGRNAGKVPVAYTLARFVKKPKGAKPGLVMLAERKTIMAVPEEGDDDAARRGR